MAELNVRCEYEVSGLSPKSRCGSEVNDSEVSGLRGQSRCDSEESGLSPKLRCGSEVNGLSSALSEGMA